MKLLFLQERARCMFNSNNAMRPFLYSVPSLETIALVHFRFNQKRLAGVESVMHLQKKLLERSGRRAWFLVGETDTDPVLKETAGEDALVMDYNLWKSSRS